MKLKIEQMNSKEIQTSKGKSTKIGIKSGGKWYGAWKGQWNQDWKVGQVIDIPDDRFSTNESNGKTYHNIAGPPKTNGNGSAGVNPHELAKLLNLVTAMAQDILEIKNHLGIGATESEESGHAGQEYQANDNDIPF